MTEPTSQHLDVMQNESAALTSAAAWIRGDVA